MYENDWNCEEHPDSICGCNLSVGEMQIRRGVLCSVDDRGRLYLRAPRRADLQLARRVAAAVAGASRSTKDLLSADIVGIREKT